MRLRLLAPALLVWGCLLPSAPASAELATIAVSSLRQPAQISAEASIEAVHQSSLAAQVAGRITALHVDAGDVVRQGQLLLTIDSGELDAATASAAAGVAEARTAVDNARVELTRARRLVDDSFISASALDLARARHDAAQAQLRAAQARHQQSRLAQAHARVHAPFAGIISSRHIESGEMAQPGRLLLTLHNPQHMRAVADLAPQRLSALGNGPLQARVELPASARHLQAGAITVLPAADANTHTVRVRVDLPANTPELLPGSFARVHFTAAERSAGLSIPAAAVLRRGELTAVYVAHPDGSFELRQLRLGSRLADGEQVEVLAGLQAHERIALDPVRAGLQPAGRQR